MKSIYALPGILGRVARTLRRIRQRIQSMSAPLSASRRARKAKQGKPHGLSGTLIVSLTSYPARYPTLHLTLGCLLDQSVRADRTILWIAHDDLDLLPPKVRRMEKHGLEIRACDDLRSYKKLVLALEEFPDAHIVTADDDIHFPNNWLEKLVEGLSQDRCITAWRVHRIRAVGGKLLPYRQWENDVQDAPSKIPSGDLLPTTGAGALFPPGSLHPIVTDREKFERQAPFGDDLWFYWCARLAGTKIRKVGGRLDLITWSGTQEDSLWNLNSRGRNDAMIAALAAEFGVEVLGLDRQF